MTTGSACSRRRGLILVPGASQTRESGLASVARCICSYKMPTGQRSLRRKSFRGTMRHPMPKKSADFDEVIRFRVSAEDKRLFEEAAAKRRPILSVSQWLREAAHEKLRRDREESAKQK